MSDNNPQFHSRRSIRLKGYDYSRAGLYFITICVQNRECLFGEIVGSSYVGAALVAALNPTPTHPQSMILNDAGRMIESEWLALKKRFAHIELHEYVVMPNHFHAILEIVENDERATTRVAPTTNKTVGDMIDAFKSITTVEYIRSVKNHEWNRFEGKLWQRNYWEHIIRDEESYERIAAYIARNPDKWNEDNLK
jgi:REP element-mobilizing transposase RayT